ncbi:MAG: PAS domain S-box protein [Parvularculaceae bacterium]
MIADAPANAFERARNYADARLASLDELTASDRLKIHVERRAMLLRNAPIAIVVSGVNAAITCALVWNLVDRAMIVGWTAAVVLLAAVRIALWRRFVARRAASHALEAFAKLHVAAMATNGALWGALAPLFAASGLLGNAFLPFIVAGMTAAALSSAAASWRAACAFNAPVLISFAVSYAVAMPQDGVAVALIVAIYAFATSVLALLTERLLTRAIRLRSRNDALTEALAKQADAARESEKKYRALIEASSDLTIVFTPEGVVSYANPAAHEALGPLLGKTTKDIVHPDDLKTFRTAGGRALTKLGEVTSLPHVCLRGEAGDYRAFGGRMTNMLYVPGVEGFVYSGGALADRPCLEQASA